MGRHEPDDRTEDRDEVLNDATDVRGRTILVTGGAGFIGSHLVDALVMGNAVRVLDDLSAGSRSVVPDGARFIEGDVRDPATLERAMRDVDLVFHEAAMVNVDRSVEDPGLSRSVNAGATVDVLEAALDVDARVVIASSAAIYGHPERVPVAESDRTTPTVPYGIDKLASDHYARAFHRLYGLPTVVLRYFNVYGPRQRGGDYSGVIDVFMNQATAGRDITVNGAGTQTRDFVHVSDVVRANLLAATTELVGEAFNVGTGRSVTISELAETIRNLTDSDSDIVHTDPRPGDIERSRADVLKARSSLGFEPDVPLERGLSSLYRWREAHATA